MRRFRNWGTPEFIEGTGIEQTPAVIAIPLFWIRPILTMAISACDMASLQNAL
jgi:hypothetical protein